MTENQPVEQAVPVKAKPWRTMLQVPLLLAAAAGIGFAGQQVWQSQTTGTKLFHNSAGEFQCPIAALFGCGAGAKSAGCSTGGCGSTAAATACASAMIEAGLGAEGCTAGDDCCAAMLKAAEAAAASEAPVSALAPANMNDLL